MTQKSGLHKASGHENNATAAKLAAKIKPVCKGDLLHVLRIY